MPEHVTPLPAGLSRRAMLRTLGAGAGATVLLPFLSDAGLLAFTDLQQRNAAPAPKALTAAQFLTLQTLVEAIIPADERSPGAKDARVADYIDLLISESDAAFGERWLAGLAALDAESAARFGKGFAALDAASLDAILADISRNEASPAAPLETFFAMSKQATIHGYYTSEIGIHRELQYKGNQFLPEFVGCATVDGRDCPHCGQKATT